MCFQGCVKGPDSALALPDLSADACPVAPLPSVGGKSGPRAPPPHRNHDTLATRSDRTRALRHAWTRTQQAQAITRAPPIRTKSLIPGRLRDSLSHSSYLTIAAGHFVTSGPIEIRACSPASDSADAAVCRRGSASEPVEQTKTAACGAAPRRGLSGILDERRSYHRPQRAHLHGIQSQRRGVVPVPTFVLAARIGVADSDIPGPASMKARP